MFINPANTLAIFCKNMRRCRYELECGCMQRIKFAQTRIGLLGALRKYDARRIMSPKIGRKWTNTSSHMTWKEDVTETISWELQVFVGISYC